MSAAKFLGLTAATLALVVLPVTGALAAVEPVEPATGEAVQGDSTYPGDPASEAIAVSDEERRIIQLRTITNAAEWSGVSGAKPYRLEIGELTTLVLVARKSPYTFEDLTDLAPSTLVRQPDGSWVLSENVVVDSGATLKIASKDGLDLRLSSTDSAYASIVTLGGSLTVAGSPEAPVTITSWDPTRGEVDKDTTNGRSYLRVIGGTADFTYAKFENLGYWSGLTGGVSLTGTNLVQEITSTEEGEVEEDKSVFGVKLVPTEGEPIEVSPDLAGYSYVTARIQNSTFDGNAFGLFVTNADGLVMADSKVSNSLVDGVVLHRDVKNSTISNTVSTDNARDGFRMTRATSGILARRLTATSNGRNGITVEGGALADGPSASGTPVTSYGNNEVSDSIASTNGRYGIEIIGGVNIIADGNEVSSNRTGIVVSEDASAVSITDNRLENNEEQGIALRDAGEDLVVTSNEVSGGAIAIYARNSGGVFSRNAISDVNSHGIALVGETGASTIERNTVTGIGPSAIDVSRTEGAVLTKNNIDDWYGTKPLGVILANIFSPLTVMWILLGLLLLVTAVSGIGRKSREIVHPYANLAPLSTFSKGVVTPEDLRKPAPEAAVIEPRERDEAFV